MMQSSIITTFTPLCVAILALIGTAAATAIAVPPSLTTQPATRPAHAVLSSLSTTQAAFSLHAPKDANDAGAPLGISNNGMHGIGPHGPVFGHGGNARRIVFVCEASGSMTNKMAPLKDELKKTIHALQPIQTFDIIFWRDPKYKALSIFCDADGLLNATVDTKRKADEFIGSQNTTGLPDPIPGIEAAFKEKPDLIYFLACGDLPDHDALLKKINDLNKDQKVKINTIAFINAANQDTPFFDLLKQIANENHGVFTVVKVEDL